LGEETSTANQGEEQTPQENKGTIILQVTKQSNWANVIVEVLAAGQAENNFSYWIPACEYFMSVVAKNSKLPFDEALQTLVKGAKTYSQIQTIGTA